MISISQLPKLNVASSNLVSRSTFLLPVSCSKSEGLALAFSTLWGIDVKFSTVEKNMLGIFRAMDIAGAGPCCGTLE